MQKLRTFFYAMSKSMSSVNYYRDVENAKAKFTYKYFVLLSSLLSLVLAIGFVFVQAPRIVTEIYLTSGLVRKMYEDDLIIAFKNGEWSLNKPEPYAIDLHLNIGGQTQSPGKKHFIIFAHDGTLDKFDQYDTYVLVNSKNIVTKDNNGFAITPLEKLNLPNGSINKNDFNTLVDSALDYTKYVKPIGFVLSGLMWFLFFFLIKGSNFLILALLVWLFGQMINSRGKFSYTNALKITLHASTLPLVVFTLMKLINYEMLNQRLSIWVEIATLALAFFIVGLLNKHGIAGKEKLNEIVTPEIYEKSADTPIDEPKTDLP